MKISATQNQILATEQELYQLVSSPKSFVHLLPEPLVIEEIADDFCQFNIPGVGSLMLRVTEKLPYSKVQYFADNDKKITTTITLFFNKIDENSTSLLIEIDADVPFFLQSMIKKPLQNLVTMIAERVKYIAENR